MDLSWGLRRKLVKLYRSIPYSLKAEICVLLYAVIIQNVKVNIKTEMSHIYVCIYIYTHTHNHVSGAHVFC